MDPNPSIEKRKLFSRIYPTTPDDEIVISGISGRFPSSANMNEFSYNLYNKVITKIKFNYIKLTVKNV